MTYPADDETHGTCYRSGLGDLVVVMHGPSKGTSLSGLQTSREYSCFRSGVTLSPGALFTLAMRMSPPNMSEMVAIT
jgi:hypothetical protein